ncbi:unnamed protein product, partial [Mesorhabditis belari]|uniref:Sugar transporter SWEET1 n=1 Tax=Mesorhabditis belari TaxID=2138241 RepID=A0AAF3JBK9_9BILA
MAFEIFTHGFSFLNLLSILAFFTTVALFFCGIPICRQIWKRGDTKEIAAAPFLMGILGGTCWLWYGWLKGDNTVLVVTSTQVFLYFSYSIFYWFMTRNKFWITIKFLLILCLCGTIGGFTYHFKEKVFHPLGFLCMTLNAADFAAPLAGLNVVIRRGATSTLPLPLCIANFLVSTEWFLYGFLKMDFYLITPNGIGSILAFSQLVLFLVLPRKPGQKSPIRRLVTSCRKNGVKDLEAEAVVEKVSPLGIEGFERKDRETSWPIRVISSLENELDNVISRVAAREQFAYTKGMVEQEETQSEEDNEENLKPNLETKTSNRRNTLIFSNEVFPKLTRSISSPNLSF